MASWRLDIETRQATLADGEQALADAELGLAGRAGSQRLRGRVVAGFERPASMRLEGVAPFGPPAFTIWSDGRFFANLYAYTTPEVVIHDHDFAGAFANLSGTTIHATYEFADAERVAPEVQVGALAIRGVEVVRPRDFVAFFPVGRG